MDYIVLEDSSMSTLPMFIIGVLLMLAAVVFIGIFGNDKEPHKSMLWFTTLLMIAGIALLAIALASLLAEAGDTDEIDASRMELISETYGIKLTEEQYRELDYPYDKPDGQPEIFGSTESAGLSADLESLSTQKLTLAWTGEELRLYGGETEETMEELPRSR